MSYQGIAGRALKTLTRKGAAVSFTLSLPGTYTEATDTWSTPTTVMVSGSALEIAGDPDTYERLSLVQSESPSLLFTSSTYGSMPKPGYSVTWGGTVYTARDVKSVAPDGTGIVATIVVSK